MKEQQEEKMFDLLTTKAIYGLSDKELRELNELEEVFPEWKDDESFELTAVAINLASIDVSEKMPAQLQSKILADAKNFIKVEEPKEEVQEVRSFERQTETVSSSLSTADSFSLSPKTSFWQRLGWGVAAFACVALAVNIYLTRVQNQPIVADNPDVIQTPAPLTDAQKREQLLASTKNIIKAEVAEAAPGKMPEIKGDVVWNNTEQKGYMRFKGLPVNDPTKQQYQLWIFENPGDKYPIDGGVFDVIKDGEVIIPIDAKINVDNPKMFAVTKEKPGGVVVSDRTGIVAIAKV